MVERSSCSRGSAARSGESGGRRDLRFRYESCNCKKFASLRIVKSHGKPTRGKLYFVCERKECTFFKWCEPIEPIKEEEEEEEEEEEDGVDSSQMQAETDWETLGLILASIDENNRTIQKLATVVMYGFWFFVIVLFVMFVCMLKFK